MNQQISSNVKVKLESSWNGLYKAGGICAVLYVLFALFVPFFMFVNNTELSHMVFGSQILNLINENGMTWWVLLQAFVLGSSFFAIITFVALYMALKNTDKVKGLIGSATAVVIHILFIAYFPVMLALGFLAKVYPNAAEAQRQSLESAATALLAINNAFNPLYESVFAVSILILSLAMLKGIFAKWVAYLGILTSIVACIALALFPLIHIGYFWWWLLFMIWFVAVGLRLFKMGRPRKGDAH